MAILADRERQSCRVKGLAPLLRLCLSNAPANITELMKNKGLEKSARENPRQNAPGGRQPLPSRGT
jgi:hypothetical protein